jgi:hypothetical protein
MTVNTLVKSIVELLTEVYAGPPDPSVTWFVDNQPGAGILSLLESVSAREASTSVDGSGERGSTIASNVEHLRWSLANANGAMRGEPYNPNWNKSWDLLDADEAGWDLLRQSLRVEFETAVALIGRQEDLPGEYLNGVLALIPHAAFHLGLIRQMVERVRQS